MGELEEGTVCSAEMMVTTYQRQYFYTTSLENATEFVRAIAEDIQRPFSVRYNPYTQTVEVLNCSDKILGVAKELKGDLALVANALKKVQERDGDLDPAIVS